jgi:hypothetical protein
MTHFYALKEDLVPVLEVLESASPVKYVRAGKVRGEVEVYTHCRDIPGLGLSSSESAVSSDRYLIVPRTAKVNIRKVPQSSGGSNFLIDQLINPDSAILTAGGLWGPDILLYGRLSTVSDTKIAQGFMRIFNRALRQKFQKVRAYWVGDGAMQMLKNGNRLTIAAQTPRDFDLKIIA